MTPKEMKQLREFARNAVTRDSAPLPDSMSYYWDAATREAGETLNKLLDGLERSSQCLTTAYLVLFLNKETKAVEGAGIFSEPGPTVCVPRVCLGYVPVVLLEWHASSYPEARDKLRETLSGDSHYEWIRDFERWDREGTG